MDKTINDILNSVIPDGWIFSTCDASIAGRWSVTIKRDKEGTKWWHTLPEETRDIVALYANGMGATMDESIEDAITKTIGRI